MNIYSDFKPTYLYIKQHSVTGKLYFGKTTRNPEKYLGSGTHWKFHIKKHGKEFIETLWYCIFYDKNTCMEFALNFSKQHDIINSIKWLNIIDENGLDGGNGNTTKKFGEDNPFYGKSHSIESLELIKIARSKQIVIPKFGEDNHRFGKICTDDHKLKTSNSLLGHDVSLETRLKISNKTKIQHRIKCSCLCCNRMFDIGNYTKHIKVRYG